MLKENLASFPDAIWVQISDHRMQVLNREHHVVAQEDCPVSFMDLGSFARDFNIAERCFNQLMQGIDCKWYEFGQPMVFIQLINRSDQQVTALELQAIKEMALGNNAHLVNVYDKDGEALEPDTLKNDHSRFLKLLCLTLVFVVAVILLSHGLEPS